jgi:hypothetical protein
MRLLNTNYRQTRVLGERIKLPEFTIEDTSRMPFRIASFKRHGFDWIERWRKWTPSSVTMEYVHRSSTG